MKPDDIIRAVARPMREASGYISMPQVPRELGISLNRMKRIVATGAVPIARVGKQYRVDVRHFYVRR